MPLKFEHAEFIKQTTRNYFDKELLKPIVEIDSFDALKLENGPTISLKIIIQR
jgi:hypothetical protein